MEKKDMDKESYSWGGIGFLALFFLIIIAFWSRGGNGFGWNNGGFNGYVPYGGHHPNTFDNYRATCDAEKTEIINTATTQYKTIEQAQLTRDAIQATASATQAKIDFYGYQDLRDKLAESQRENMMLQNQLFVKDQLAPITAQLSSIQCNMLRKPDVTGVGAVCPNAGIINGLGINSLNGLNGCGCNGLA